MLRLQHCIPAIVIQNGFWPEYLREFLNSMMIFNLSLRTVEIFLLFFTCPAGEGQCFFRFFCEKAPKRRIAGSMIGCLAGAVCLYILKAAMVYCLL